MKLFGTKKGQGVFDFSSKSISWMILGSIAALVFVAFAIVLGVHQVNLSTSSVSLNIDSLLFRFTEQCFAIEDDSRNVLVHNSIDLEKFTQENFNKCYTTNSQTGAKSLNFELVLPHLTKKIATNNYFSKADRTISTTVKVKEGSEIKERELIINVQENLR